jgi:hypothetical protein
LSRLSVPQFRRRKVACRCGGHLQILNDVVVRDDYRGCFVLESVLRLAPVLRDVRLQVPKEEEYIGAP